MFRNECVHLDSFQNTDIKITCRVEREIEEIEGMMNYRKIPVTGISPGLIQLRKGFWVGL